MNQRGCYGKPRPLLGATPTSEGPRVGPMFAIAIGGIAIAMIATRSVRGAHRKLRSELREINRPLAHA